MILDPSSVASSSVIGESTPSLPVPTSTSCAGGTTCNESSNGGLTALSEARAGGSGSTRVSAQASSIATSSAELARSETMGWPSDNGSVSTSYPSLLTCVPGDSPATIVAARLGPVADMLPISGVDRFMPSSKH